jgi:murein DD-endopeptidase MepM/ murein hydrolase activator NlpD
MARMPQLAAVPLSLLTLSFSACGNVSDPSVALPDDDAVPSEFRLTHVEPKTGVSFRYPTDLHVYSGRVPGRHRGLDSVLVTSFALDPEGELPEAAAPGELMLHVAFEGSDLQPGESLRQFTHDKLASIFYLPTGAEFDLGGKHFVELEGDTGTLWVTSQGANVYSVFIYGSPEHKTDARLRGLVSSLRLSLADAIPIDPAARGLWAGGVNPEVLNSGGVRFPDAVPAMRLPFTGSRVFSGGPHGSTTTNGCSALFATSTQSGIDLAMPVGTEVLATAGGTVVYSGNAGGSIGNAVGIDHGTGFSTRYWHLNSIAAGIVVRSPAVSVVQGKVLGTSGYPTAPHLHLEFRNWPANSAYPANGLTIDGYVIRGYVRISDSLGWNYQGTMIRGTATRNTFSYCGGTNNAYRWTGSTSTAYAGSGSVSSSNVRVP